MKKRILILFLLAFFITGCDFNSVSKKAESLPKKEQKTEEKIETTYFDTNTTPIAFYDLQGNTLKRIHTISKKLVVEQDVGLFQVFPSQEENISLSSSFGQEFFNQWSTYNNNNSLKIEFSISFTKSDGENVYYNILDPSHTFDQWEYLMNYLYDDYANLGKGFYSHIEMDQFNDNTLFTAFKMQSSYQCDQIASSIKLTVFTYDTEDDFDENGVYRGNSYDTLTICVNDYPCE